MSQHTQVSGPRAAALPEGWVEISSYKPAVEVFRSRTVSADTGGEVDACFRKGILLRSDPPVHTQRRKTMNKLMRRDGHRWFRSNVLYPTVAKRLGELRDGADAEGRARIDLVDFGTLVNLDFAAALIGLDRAREPEGAAELRQLHEEVFVGAVDAFQELRLEDLDSTLLNRALAANDAFVERFFNPAYEQHEELLARFEAGEIGEDDLPHDLMMLLVAHADPAWIDRDLAVRDSTALMRAAVHTSTQMLCNTLELLDDWFVDHPADAELRSDPEFRLLAIEEALRLRTIIPAFIRRATEDMELCDGTRVATGEHILVRTGPASRDRAIFGEDADEFNPRREVPTGAYRYGLAFNTGVHMCYGIPMVLGSQGVDGSLVHLLGELYRAGASLDPEDRPHHVVRESVDHFPSFPLRLQFGADWTAEPQS
jgi:cytochrome P450